MYETIFPYKGDFGGKYLFALSGALVGIDYPTETESGKYRSAEQSVTTGTKIQLTGLFLESGSGAICYQCIIYLGTEKKYGYIWDDNLNYWGTSVNNTVAQAQTILNELIEYQKAILESNLLCARIIRYCGANGIALPATAKSDLYALQNRLIARNEKIKSTGVESVEEGESPNFGKYNDELVEFMSNPGIGVLPLIYVIVIAAVAIAAVATSSILIYKALHKEAKADFQYSSDLTAQLVKYLPPDTYKQLMAENEANAQKAQDAIDAASGKSWITTAKYIGFGVLAIWAFDKFNKNLSFGKQ